MSGTVWATEPHADLPIKMGTSGAAAKPPTTVFKVFQKAVENHGENVALKFKDTSGGVSADDAPWQTLTWAQFYMETLRFGKSLMSLGFAPHRSINIIGFNSTEWFIANMGAIAAGGIPAGIYTSNLPEACQYITNHSEAEVVVVENEAQLDKFVKLAATLTSVKAIVMYRGNVPEGTDCGFPVYTWDQFMELGGEIPDSSIQERIEAQKPGECCSLIYTSGTTGKPKAVMISHDNMTWTAETLTTQFPLNETSRVVSYLPLSHIAAQILDMHGPMFLGCTVAFAQPDALKGSLVKTLREIRPTVFFGVPRVWEKMYEKMQEVGRSIKGAKKSISTWAKGKGLAHARMQQYGAGGGVPCGFGVANALAFSKVKANLGLDQATCCFTGAAPIAVEIIEYFASLNIHILELFGQSECTGPQTFNTAEAWKIGTCGRPMAGTESKLVPETGELCYRGRHIFMGYMHNPEKTAETIDEDGWMHSGDVATFDEDGDDRTEGPSGFMQITGRIKELIITAGGENVPPVLIENEFKTELPCIANCMVVGDKRKFLSILIALRSEVAEDGTPTSKLAGDSLTACEKIGSTATTIEEAKADPKWTEYIDKAVKACNNRTTSNAQRVAKWALLPHDFSVEGGELTPTLKLKRGPASEKYADIIEGLYA
ncbi:unnamed protein product [Ectocarpus sp. CCAP 1310/34]|nr:unnamed protein product [Ectocarpus sp. CCAP 1310/34]